MGGLSATESRAVGALLGLAIGDAIGTTLEFSPRDSRPPLTDMIGGGPFGLDPGQWTDDTAMALALADALHGTSIFNAHRCMDNFVAWWREGQFSCTGECFDIGIATRAALARFMGDGAPYAGSTDPDTAGNGSLMRLAPVAIWGLKKGAEATRTAAAQSSRTTHGALECVVACEDFALALQSAIKGDWTSAVARNHWRLAALDWENKDRAQIKSSGYVVHSLEAALWCIRQGQNFGESVLLAANLGDDADTVAAITGQLAGARWGVDSIPAAWRERVAWGARIESTARALLD